MKMGRPEMYGWNDSINLRCTTDVKERLWRLYKEQCILYDGQCIRADYFEPSKKTRREKRRVKPSFSAWLSNMLDFIAKQIEKNTELNVELFECMHHRKIEQKEEQLK